MDYLSQLKTTTESSYVSVSEGAGVGKSRLIKAIFQTLLRYFNALAGQNPLQIKVLLCAPTGKAGHNIDGTTLHSTFRLPISQAGDKMCALDAASLNTIRCKLADLKLIIIDEISMVGTRMFHQIDTRLRQIFQTEQPFGGISILVVGDFRQLSPVGDSWIFTGNRTNPTSELVGPYLWRMFSFYELTEIMRQRDDIPFAHMLNNMASECMTADDVSLIQNRMFNGKKLLDIPQEALHLFKTNVEVDAFNNLRLVAFTTKTALANTFDKVLGEGTKEAKQHFFSVLQF